MHHGREFRQAWRNGLRCLGVACLGVALASWLGCGSDKTPAPDAPGAAGAANPATAGKPAAPSAEEIPPGAGKEVTPQSVLESMVAAYKQASSYADGGQVALQGQVGDQKIDDKSDFLLALVRPNKILLRSYQGIVVSDGKQLSAFIKSIRNQVTQREAPAQLSIPALYADHVLAGALMAAPPQTSALFPAPLVLLMAKDPLKTLLYRAEKVAMLPSEKIGDKLCYRVQVQRADGATLFWIDQASFVLRRVEYPTEGLKTVIAGGPVQGLSLVADFAAAQLGTEVDPKAFQMEVPPNARVLKSFAPPDLELMGKPVPEFSFVDLDGKAITPKSLAGKIAVLELWATTCLPCRDSLPEVQEIYKEFKGSDKVTFLAVSVDEPSVDNKKLQETFAQWKIDIPIARDPQNTRQAMQVLGVPTSLLLGADGVVHHFLSGGQPGASVELAGKLKRLLAGDDVARLTMQQYQQFTLQYEQMMQQWAKDDLYVGAAAMEQEIPRAQILPRSEPASLKMTRLWTCAKLKAPGNVLAIDRPGAAPRILVLDNANTVAELGPDGNVVATTALKIPAQAALAALRTGAGADGRRLFVGFNSALAQLFLMDDAFQPLLTFPKDEENPRMGIADVQLAGLSEGGPLMMLVGYWGIAGVQAVSLDGDRLWANKSLVEVSRIAVLGPDPQGRRSLLCTNIDRGSLVLIDSKGERKGEIKIPNRNVAWVLGADLNGDGQSEFCALAPEEAGTVLALGLTTEAKELWTYPLPKGMHETAIERAIAGQLLPDGPGQWILPAADGTIHVLTADGKLLDRFAYGARLAGLATTRLDGRPVLLVATPQAVEAWQVEPAAKR